VTFSVSTPEPAGLGIGLFGDYYANTNFTGEPISPWTRR